jgi:hypothetical protein
MDHRVGLRLALFLCVLQFLVYFVVTSYSRQTRFSYLYEPDFPSYAALVRSRQDFAAAAIRLKGALRSSQDAITQVPPDSAGSTPLPTFCVGVIATDARLNTHYLLQTVGSLSELGGVDTSDPRVARFFVSMRVSEPPSSPSLKPSSNDPLDLSHPDLSALISAGVEVLPHSHAAGKASQWLKNQVDDYVLAMRTCVPEEGEPLADYVVLMEEDVWATKDFLAKVSDAVSKLEQKTPRSAVLKLFATSFWSGFERTSEDVTKIAMVGLAFAVAMDVLIEVSFKTLPRLYFVSLTHSLHAQVFLRVLGKDSASLLPLSRKGSGEQGGWARKRPPTGLSKFCSWGKVRWLLRMYFVGVGVAIAMTVEKQGLGLTDMSSRGVYENTVGASNLGMVYVTGAAARCVCVLGGEL